MVAWRVRGASASEALKAWARDKGWPPAVAELLAQRGLTNGALAEAFLSAREARWWEQGAPESQGLRQAADRIRRAVAEQEPFVIYGDYDADGVTSTALLYRYLKRGLKANCEAFLPDRFKDGYGVTAAAIERIHAQGIRLVLTCDNGISANPAIERGRELGVEVVVTDHHLVPEVLPPAVAIAHPAVDFPEYKDLAGVGVAFAFCLAMEEGPYKPKMDYLLDLAAIGTIGDVVPLDGKNRPLVWAALKRFRNPKGKRFQGLDALALVAKSRLESLSARDVGFQMAPRLNAAGRLEHPEIGFNLLVSQDEGEALEIAQHLDGVNRERRVLSAELEAQVVDRLEASWDFEERPFVVLHDPAFHHGITGIIAGRVKERFRVPVLLFSRIEKEGKVLWKASGRAPEGVHLYECLHAARAHLVGFGGHAGAAGCAAEEDQLEALVEALNAYLKGLGWQRSPEEVVLDALLPLADADERWLEALDALEPLGQRNPEPVVGLLGARVVGRRTFGNGKHLTLTVHDGRSSREVKLWGKGPEADSIPERVNLRYRASLNEYRGTRSVDLFADLIEEASEALPPPPKSTAKPQAAPQAQAKTADAKPSAPLPPQAAGSTALAFSPATESPPIRPTSQGGSPHERWALPTGPRVQALAGEAPAGACWYAYPGASLPLGVKALNPWDPELPHGATVVLCDPPLGEEALEALRARASCVLMAYPEALEELALEPEWLGDFHARCLSATSYEEAVASLGPEARPSALGARGLLRELGLLAFTRGQPRALVAPPGATYALAGSPALARLQSEQRFRRELRAGGLRALQEAFLAPD